MRKPLLALSLVVSTGLGAVPVADALAATPSHGTTTSSSYSSTTGNGTARAGSSTPTYTTQTSTAVRSSNSVSGAAIVSTALKYLGYPYTATGNSPSTGFSCIGFVSYVYRSNGIPLPGDLGSALAYAPQVPFSDLQVGDILYFQNTVWAGLSHAAIYLGGGKFVHAEYYGYGVRVSSFNNDPKDGNYWIGKYLGANRPWGGAALGAIPAVPTAPTVNSGLNTSPTTAVTKSVVSGPTALVSVPSLNVRTTASKNSAVQTVIQQGSSVTVLSHKNGWYKVQLANGSIGWVVAAGLGMGSTSTSSVAATTVQPTVGNPVAPKQTLAPTVVHHTSTVTSTVSGLRVHSGPSTAAPVVNAVQKGQHLTVVAKSSGWVKVQLSDGSVGWVSAAYAAVKKPTVKITTRVLATTPKAVVTGPRAAVAMNVRTGPGLNHAVASTLVPGAAYRVIGRTNGWLHVQLANGNTGWVSGAVAGASKTSSTTAPTYKQVAYTHKTYKPAVAKTPSSHVTVGVRVHSSPGIKAPVVGTAISGTQVRVLGHRGAWTFVRLPSGQTGYVLGSYIA
jgi:uncharacterized protein YgiM (DUF1202 family)/cell wall-associated NlpC family hydrolase